ncbi:MAG: replication-relaxation family protein, partial [Haloechinothrix sp.]
ELHWFVEVDRGNEHRGALTHKIATYVAAWRDGGEQVRAGVFPRVLWIVPSDRRAAALQDLWTSLPGVPTGMMTATHRAKAINALVEPPPQ